MVEKPRHEKWGCDRVLYITSLTKTCCSWFHAQLLEGVLQHHLHVLCIGLPEELKKAIVELKKDEQWLQADSQEFAEELEGLQKEVEEANEQADIATCAMHEAFSPTLSTTSNVTPTQDNPQPNSYPFIDDDNEMIDLDSDFVPLDSEIFMFSNSELAAIHNCISNISLPTWVGRPPSNFGNKSHRKLKAHELLSLFSTIFPLIILEFWYSPTAMQTQKNHLECFHHLVSAMNITCSFKTSNEEADQYTHHYIEYQKLIPVLFPQSHSLPNHHFAMHGGSQLKYWGPNPPISKFSGK